MGPSQSRDWTCVPCIGRWILIHCATRKLSIWGLKKSNSKDPASGETECSREEKEPRAYKDKKSTDCEGRPVGIVIDSDTSQASLVAQLVKNPPAMWETWVQSLGWEDPLKKGYPHEYSGLESSMDCIVHGVTKSQSWLSDFHFLTQGKKYLSLKNQTLF